jgi:hypothetical protein
LSPSKWAVQCGQEQGKTATTLIWALGPAIGHNTARVSRNQKPITARKKVPWRVLNLGSRNWEERALQLDLC